MVAYKQYSKAATKWLNKYLISINTDIRNMSEVDKVKIYCSNKNIDFTLIESNIYKFLKKEYLQTSEFDRAKKYNDYLKSYKWKLFRKSILEERNYTCERCGLKPEQKLLHIHHKTYERIFNELPSDLELVCKNCHSKIHKNKKIKKSKAKNSVYSEQKLKTNS
ncbi:MAG: hypothetical protein RLZZ605_204 [Bacteroidota bacterium]|jgi:DNA-directed RNA polymerase subunit RPC12/RpoP